MVFRLHTEHVEKFLNFLHGLSLLMKEIISGGLREFENPYVEDS